MPVNDATTEPPRGKAVYREDCPDLEPTVRCRCKCGKCAVCGHQKHTAIHGPILGDDTGRPYGHAYVPLCRHSTIVTNSTKHGSTTNCKDCGKEIACRITPPTELSNG